MAVSDEEVFNWLQSNSVDDRAILSAMQEFGVTPEQINRVSSIPVADINSRIEGVVGNVYNDQFGRDASADDIADAWNWLNSGNLVDEGVQRLNNSQEGYNYDTNDIVAAYRETFGRNPTQEEYVSTMAQLGIENFDRSTLGASGQYTAATVAALESDPYAGRYAGYNPYQLPSDAANVSTNILGDKVQYISPITQRPVVSSFENGNLQLSAGDDVFTPEQIRAAIGTASATGALTKDELATMTQDIDSAQNADDFYAAFSKPEAVASLGANGTQTGVGKTYEQALANGFGGTDMDAMYKALYKDIAPYKTSDVFTPAKLQPTITSTKSALLNGFQQGAGLSGYSTPKHLANLGTFGAAGDERMGAGTDDYQSEMVKSLRDADNQLKSTNTGVTKYGYVDGAPTPGRINVSNSMQGNAAFNPEVFQQDVASAGDVNDWNTYSTYRTNSLNAKSPYVSFAEWLSGGKPDGKPVEVPVTNYDGLTGGGA